MLNRLRNQQSIERIAVEWRKRGQMRHCSLVDWQGGDSVRSSLLRQIVGGTTGEREFAQVVLDDRLPYRGGAQVDLVRRFSNGRPERLWESRVSGDVPKKDMRIEQ